MLITINKNFKVKYRTKMHRQNSYTISRVITEWTTFYLYIIKFKFIL